VRRTVPATGRPISVAIVNRHPIERESLAALLGGHPEVAVVAKVDDVSGLIGSRIRPLPQVVLVTLEAGPTAFAVVERFVHTRGAPPLVVLRRRYAPALVRTLLHLGARGCVSTRGEPSDLVSALTAAAAGETHVCPTIARLLVEPGRAPNDAGDLPLLTPREHEVLAHIAQGRTDREIAAVLGLRVGTVHTHRKNVMAKLGVHNATTLLRRALALGLVEP